MNILPKRINLIPKSHRLRAPYSVDHLLIVASLVLVFTVFYASYNKSHKEKQLQGELLSLAQKHSQISNRVRELTNVSSMNAAKKAQERLVQRIIGEKLNWADVFRELSLVTPSKTWLTEFSAQNNNGQLEVSIFGSTSSQSKMARFYSALEKSDHFNKMLMVSSEIANEISPDLYEFHFATPNIKTKSTLAKKGAK